MVRKALSESYQRFLDSTAIKFGVLIFVLLAVGLWVASRDLRPNLAHLDVVLLSGSKQGQYHVFAGQLAERAAQERGHIRNRVTLGSVQNLAILAKERERCRVKFGLAQDGLDWKQSPGLQLLGRLDKAESVFFLGRDADKIENFGDLEGKRIGVGPEGSGTERIAYQVLGSRGLASLKHKLSNHSWSKQLEMLASGQLDLGVFVIDEDADIVDRAILKLGLQIANFRHLDVVARRLSFARVGRIGAGQYDPVQLLPPRDKRVLRIETLLLGNGCASRSEVAALLATVADIKPGFIPHNRTTPNRTGLALAPAARRFFDNQGRDLMDQYAPWLLDIMPPSNWVHIALGISILFNVMAFWHRFRLWRIDANRVRIERDIQLLFGDEALRGDLHALPVAQDAQVRELSAVLVSRLARLLRRARRQAQSILVPMGSEMAYRYQESLIAGWIEELERVAPPAPTPPAAPDETQG
ncbi:MAG: hypothetical protein KC503_30055 [Myxococcales bacterium]|nr:hypothetical protein [Myxococcales bacterium]